MPKKDQISKTVAFKDGAIAVVRKGKDMPYTRILSKRIDYAINKGKLFFLPRLKKMKRDAIEILDDIPYLDPEHEFSIKTIREMRRNYTLGFESCLVKNRKTRKWQLSYRPIKMIWRACPISAFVHTSRRYAKLIPIHNTLISKGITPILITLVYKVSNRETDLHKCLLALRRMRNKLNKEFYSYGLVEYEKMIFRAEMSPDKDGYKHHIHLLVYPSSSTNVIDFCKKMEQTWSHVLSREGIQTNAKSFHYEASLSNTKSSFDYVISNPFTKFIMKTETNRKQDLRSLLRGWLRLELFIKSNALGIQNLQTLG